MTDSYVSLIIAILGKYQLNMEVAEITGDTNFISEKLMKSFDILNFIADIELQFGVEFSPEEMHGNGIHKISGLAELVRKKLG